MSAWAKPGVKVVCVDAKYCNLSVGQVYEISSVRAAYGFIFLRLVGEDQNDGFYIHRFRPLITQSDDLALFTHHLDGLRIGESA